MHFQNGNTISVKEIEKIWKKWKKLNRNKISLKDIIKTKIKEAFKRLSIKELQKFFKKGLACNHESCFDPIQPFFYLLEPPQDPNPDEINVKTAFQS